MRRIYFILVCVITSFSAYANKTDSTKNDVNKMPVIDAWSSNMLIDAQTTITPNKKELEFIIQHRFTGLGNGVKDLYGLYGASNILLGLNYGISRKNHDRFRNGKR